MIEYVKERVPLYRDRLADIEPEDITVPRSEGGKLQRVLDRR